MVQPHTKTFDVSFVNHSCDLRPLKTHTHTMQRNKFCECGPFFSISLLTYQKKQRNNKTIANVLKLESCLLNLLILFMNILGVAKCCHINMWDVMWHTSIQLAFNNNLIRLFETSFFDAEPSKMKFV